MVNMKGEYMFCPKCGTNIQDNFKFCPQCGFNVAVIRNEIDDNVVSGGNFNSTKPDTIAQGQAVPTDFNKEANQENQNPLINQELPNKLFCIARPEKIMREVRIAAAKHGLSINNYLKKMGLKKSKIEKLAWESAFNEKDISEPQQQNNRGALENNDFIQHSNSDNKTENILSGEYNSKVILNQASYNLKSTSNEGHTMKTLKIVVAIIVVIFSLAFAKGIGKVVGKSVATNYNQGKAEGAIEKTLLEISKQTNAQLPIMVDNETRLDTTVCLGKQLHYKYTMVNYSENAIDKAIFRNDITARLANYQCNNDNMVKLLKMGVEYYYIYFDKNGALIMTINISKENCGL